MAVALACFAALFYGTSDFLGGLAARRHNALAILAWSYPVGAVLMAAMLPLFPGTLSGRTLLLGFIGGLAGVLAVSLLYRLLTVAAMNVISPVSAVFAALIPVAVGVLVGERPATLAWVGIGLGLAAVVLISRSPTDAASRATVRAVGLAAVAGAGFGVYFVCLARAHPDSGLWPLIVSRVTSAIVVPLTAARLGDLVVLPAAVGRLAVTAGALDALANMFFLLASRHGYLSLASVVTALYPAATVLLAVVVLHERTGRIQRLGLAPGRGGDRPDHPLSDGRTVGRNLV